MKKINFICGIFILSVSLLFAQQIEFSQLKGAKRNNIESGYWEIAWGEKPALIDGKAFQQIYPVEDKCPLLGVYYRKFGAGELVSDIFETNPKTLHAELKSGYKDNISGVCLTKDYEVLLYTKAGKEFGIVAPRLGIPDIVLTQRFFGRYDRIIYPDTSLGASGKYNERWIGEKEKWNVFTELIDSSFFDTDNDGLWNGRERDPAWIKADRLFDNYGGTDGGFIDYILFIPATFIDLSLSENNPAFSFIYLNNNNEEKEISIQLDPLLTENGKTRIGFINFKGKIEMIQKGATGNKTLTTIYDPAYPYSLWIKANTLKVEGAAVIQQSQISQKIETPVYFDRDIIIDEGFESINKFEDLLIWEKTPTCPATVEIDNTVSRNGSKSLKITFDSPVDFNFYHITLSTKIAPATEYTFSAYVKTSFESGDMAFDIIDKRGYTVFFKSSERLSGTTDWTPLYAHFTTPKDAEEIVIRVRHFGTDSPEKPPLKGTIWIDDLKLQKGKVEIQYSKTTQTEITIHQDVIKRASKKLLGIGYDPFNIGRVLLEPKTNEIRKDYLSLFTGYPFNLVKWAGNTTSYYKWKRSIGPLEQRQPQEIPGRLWDKQVEMGIVEFIKSVIDVKPDAMFMFVVNIITDTPQDAADLAEFLTGDEKTYWGSKRAELGIKKPVNVIGYDLGSEMDTTLELDDYIRRCKEVISAIRKVQPDAKFLCFAGTAPHDENWNQKRKSKTWRDWHKRVIEELKDQIDYITFHAYYGNSAELEQYINIISKDIKEITGSDKIKISIGEHGVWPSWPDPSQPWENYWYQTHSLSGCLKTGEWIVRMLNRKDVEIASCHNFSSGPWGLVYSDKTTGKLYTTGIYDLFKVLDEALDKGESVLRVSTRGENTNIESPACRFIAGAIRRMDGGLNIILVNREELVSRDISFNLLDGTQYILKEEIILTGKTMDSYNKVDKKEIIVERKKHNELFDNKYFMEPKKLVILKLDKKTQ